MVLKKKTDILIGSKHMKKCSPLLTNMEMKIKTIIKYHFTPTEWL